MQFYQFTQKEFEEFLGVRPDGYPVEKGGFHRMVLPGTIEVVYGKRVHPELTLRIYSTIQDGSAREKGADAIRIGIFWRPSPEVMAQWTGKSWPIRVGGDTKVLRVKGWKENLHKRLSAYEDLMPGKCSCGAPTVYRKPKKSQTWKAFWGCVWAKQCPAQQK